MMSISNTNKQKSKDNSVLVRCQRLLTDHHTLLRRHRYLSERLTSIQTQIIEASRASHATLEAQVRAPLDAVEQRIKALQRDKWLDKLFSIAENECQVQQIEKLMDKWGQSSYDSVAHWAIIKRDKADNLSSVIPRETRNLVSQTRDSGIHLRRDS